MNGKQDPGPKPNRMLAWLIAAALTGAIVFGALWFVNGPMAYARIATGYVAQQTCACLNVSNRTMDSCLAEYPADARKQVTIKAEGQSVRASAVFGLVHAEAVNDGEFGCSIKN